MGCIVPNMKRITGVILMFWMAIALAFWTRVTAMTSPLLIVAIQTGSTTSASQEYIEIANVSGGNIDLNTVKLEYFSADPKSMTTPSRTIRLQGSLAAGQSYLVASNGYLNDRADGAFSATLAAAGGHLRLSGAAEYDLVGWGTATHPGGTAALPPAAGEQIVRRPGSFGGNSGFQDTGNNSDDFISGNLSPTGAGQQSGNLILSELLPDPASPLTDAKDEFIEIQNIGVETVNLRGYYLISGETKKFTLPAKDLQSGGYGVWYAPESKLTLANSGGRLRLFGPGGIEISQTSYGQAQPGKSWNWDGGSWQWSSAVTPDSENIISAATSGDTSNKKTTALKAKAKAKSKAKTVKSAKVAKKGQVKGSSTDQAGAVATEQAAGKPAIHNTVVAGVGGLAVLYGVYEYRDDIKNIYFRLRKNGRGRGELG